MLNNLPWKVSIFDKFEAGNSVQFQQIPPTGNFTYSINKKLLHFLKDI